MRNSLILTAALALSLIFPGVAKADKVICFKIPVNGESLNGPCDLMRWGSNPASPALSVKYVVSWGEGTLNTIRLGRVTESNDKNIKGEATIDDRPVRFIYVRETNALLILGQAGTMRIVLD